MRKFLFIFAFFFVVLPIRATELYIAPTATGASTGADCGDALPYTFFNNSANWPSPIGPGTTVHVCPGTYTAALNTSMFVFQRSGSPGQVITLQFENGVTLSSPAFSANGAINLAGNSYILIDGANGIIQNTANGSALENQIATRGIFNSGQISSNIEIRNLTIQNLYVRIANTVSDEGIAVVSGGVSIQNAGSNILLHGITSTQNGKGGISIAGGSGNSSNWQIYNNTIREACWHINMNQSASGSYTATGLYIYNNDISDNDQYWDTNDYFHNDPIFIYGVNGGAYSNAYIYNNDFHGAMGNLTSFIYVSSDASGPVYIFNNVFRPTSDATATGIAPCTGNGWVGNAGSVQPSSLNVYNNTFDGSQACTQAAPAPYNNTGAYVVDSSFTSLNFENNIVWGMSGLYLRQNNLSSGTINYNDYWNLNRTVADPFRVIAVTYSWSATVNPSKNYWTATIGQDMNGVYANPNLSSADMPQSGSAAIGAASNLSNVCSGQPNPGLGALCFDKAGSARPSSGPWDAGALNGNGGTGPQPPTNLQATVH